MMLLAGVMGLMLKICNIFFIQQIPLLSTICFYGADLLFLYLLFSMYLAYRKTNAEDPLVINGVVIRSLIVVFIIAFLCEANLMRETEYYGSVSWLQYLLPYFIGYLPGMLLPVLTLLAFVLSSPHLAFKKAAADRSFYMDDAPSLPAPDEVVFDQEEKATKNTSVNMPAQDADAEDKGENQ